MKSVRLFGRLLALSTVLCLTSPTRAQTNLGPGLRSDGGIVTVRTPGPESVLIPAGTFVMGADSVGVVSALQTCERQPDGGLCDMDLFSVEHPTHNVGLDAYWLDRTEVTVERYERCVSAGACSRPPLENGSRRFDRPEYPIVLVTHREASDFCQWAGGRLPTEAEWERAARGREGRPFPWGRAYDPYRLNHGRYALPFFVGYDWAALDDGDGFLELAPVGSFPAGRTPDGIDDLAGNVEEWVFDYFSPAYPAADVMNPRGPDQGDFRVVRGGSYLESEPMQRSSARKRAPPSSRSPTRGFRCARDAR